MTTKNTKFNQAQGAGIEEAKIISETKTSLQVIEGFSLEKTMQIVEDLHRKKRHRDRIEFTIDGLNKFVFEQGDENLDSDGYYQGCELKLTDDKRNVFTTKNPICIAKVVEYLKVTFQERLTEIESELVIPAA